MVRSCLAVLALSAAFMNAQEADTRVPFVRATGEGTVFASPDQATIQVGVTTQAPAAETAASQNARQTTSVLAALKAAAGAGAQIKTVGYSINPNYRYPRDGGTPAITGYTASNILQVRLSDLTRIGSVIDAVTKVGANTVGGIQYGLRDEQPARAEALAEASRAAQASAQAMAAALGVRVVRVRSAEASFSGGGPRPMMAMAAMAREMAAPTPVEPGTLEIRASVTVTLDVAK